MKIVDGIVNFLNGIGTRMDPRTSLEYQGDGILNQGTLDALHRSEGLGMKIINTRTRDMTRAGLKLDKNIQKKLDEYSIQKVIKKALRYEDVYGGSIIVALNNDRDLSKPMISNKILKFVVYDRYDIVDSEETDISDPINGGLPEVYHINDGKVNYKVHYSRVYRLDGIEVPYRMQYTDNLGFGLSLFDRMYSGIKDVLSAKEGINQIIDNFITGILKIKDLSELLDAEGGEKLVNLRLNTLDKSKHILNTMLLDAEGEDYEKKPSSVSGLADLFETVVLVLCGMVNMPYTILIGTSPKGMNATGKSDIQLWYDEISSMQDDRLRGLYIWLFKKLNINVDIEFNSLWQYNPKEEIEMKKIDAEADKIYSVDSMAIDTNEVRKRAVEKYYKNVANKNKRVEKKEVENEI